MKLGRETWWRTYDPDPSGTMAHLPAVAGKCGCYRLPASGIPMTEWSYLAQRHTLCQGQPHSTTVRGTQMPSPLSEGDNISQNDQPPSKPFAAEAVGAHSPNPISPLGNPASLSLKLLSLAHLPIGILSTHLSHTVRFSGRWPETVSSLLSVKCCWCNAARTVHLTSGIT